METTTKRQAEYAEMITRDLFRGEKYKNGPLSHEFVFGVVSDAVSIADSENYYEPHHVAKILSGFEKYSAAPVDVVSDIVFDSVNAVLEM